MLCSKSGYFQGTLSQEYFVLWIHRGPFNFNISFVYALINYNSGSL